MVVVEEVEMVHGGHTARLFVYCFLLSKCVVWLLGRG